MLQSFEKNEAALNFSGFSKITSEKVAGISRFCEIPAIFAL
jgi:hypothetical protein